MINNEREREINISYDRKIDRGEGMKRGKEYVNERERKKMTRIHTEKKV